MDRIDRGRSIAEGNLMAETNRRTSNQTVSSNRRLAVSLCVLALVLLTWTHSATADLPIRVSIKFMVNSSGDRPSMGLFNTDALVNAEADAGTEIMKQMKSEHRILVTEIIDLPQSLWRYSGAAINESNLNTIRDLARADPTTWSWRTNAINVYVTASGGSAYSLYPPENNMILFGQGCTNTPSCLVHEMGHSLSLRHTHESGGDDCDDTLADSSSWSSKDDMANFNYGSDYASLTDIQQDNVDMTWHNIMSYHTGSPQLRYTDCQKDKASYIASIDTWFLTKLPVYVGHVCVPDTDGNCTGSWDGKFLSLQDALDAGGLDGKVIVLDDIDTTMTQPDVNFEVEITSRRGTSHVDQGAQSWQLPTELGDSSHPQARAAMRASQAERTASRREMRLAEKAAASAARLEDRSAILKEAKKIEKEHADRSLGHLRTAEYWATGDEKLAIQMELARTHWHRGEYGECQALYDIVAEATDQDHLREWALSHAEECRVRLAVVEPARTTVEDEEDPES